VSGEQSNLRGYTFPTPSQAFHRSPVSSGELPVLLARGGRAQLPRAHSPRAQLPRAQLPQAARFLRVWHLVGHLASFDCCPSSLAWCMASIAKRTDL
jgi:hypothetical protein